ncbi:MAG: hypothetical protein IKC91_02715, partial [Clostridia bacterium]|nr:hypothetical protein [Clostridia bacterium]
RQVINNVKNTSSLYIMKTLFTAIVAVICIILQHEYLFTTNNLLLFELMVAGIPSIILSLQPNTDRLQGKYFSYVLCHAIPAAMTLAFSVMSMYVASMIQHQDFVPEYQALAVMALTFTGVAMLYRQCLPFNLLRAITFTVSAVACVAVFCIPYLATILYTDWVNVQFSATGILLLLCLIQFAVPLSKWLLVMFTAIQKALDKNS